MSASEQLRVAVLDDAHAIGERVLSQRLAGVANVVAFADYESGQRALVERLSGCQAVVLMRERTAIPAALLRTLPELQLIVTTGMRNASIDVAEAIARGVVVCGTRSQTSPAVELTWGLILALLRNLPEEVEALRVGGWQVSLGSGLEGQTLGIVGLGRIGTSVARIAPAFGVEVQAWSPTLTQERADAAGVRFAERERFFRSSDIVSLHTKVSDVTRGLVGEDELGMMRPSAYLINTSRPAIVDRGALLAAVTSGAIAGAALDVHPVEPLPVDDPIRSHPGIIATPHLGYATRENFEMQYHDAADAVVAFLAGKPIRTLNG